MWPCRFLTKKHKQTVGFCFYHTFILIISLPLPLMLMTLSSLWSRCLKAGLGTAHCRQSAPGRVQGRERGLGQSRGNTGAVATREIEVIRRWR